MSLGKWTLHECNYCQGSIGETPVWFGGYPFHRVCLERRNEPISGYLNELQRQLEIDKERFPG